MSFDVAAVKLLTRKRIGEVAVAKCARGNDLDNGIVVYPIMGIAAILLVGGTTFWAHRLRVPQSVTVPLLLAYIGTVVHSLCATRAAPIALGLRPLQMTRCF